MTRRKLMAKRQFANADYRIAKASYLDGHYDIQPRMSAYGPLGRTRQAGLVYFANLIAHSAC